MSNLIFFDIASNAKSQIWGGQKWPRIKIKSALFWKIFKRLGGYRPPDPHNEPPEPRAKYATAHRSQPAT